MDESKYIILIVDDSRMTRLMLKQALEDFNFVVEEADSGEKALQIFEQIQPDLVLLDVQMTGIDGFTTCAELRLISGNKHVPIVMSTSFDDVNSINKAYSVGATDFITKPFNWDLLGHRLRYIIRSSNDYRELQKSKEELVLAQNEIKELNNDLERRVNERTTELIKANNELKIALDSLKSTQNQLVESEKIAYIGSLVTSITNEANTPIDISNTTIINFRHKLNDIVNSFNDDKLKRSDLKDFIELCQRAVKTLEVNLQNASTLIKNFKQISIDQIMETRKSINLKDYLEEIIFSLKPALKKTHLQVNIVCEDDIFIETYPGVLYQVISILIMNSITHAFGPDEKGTLTISITREDHRIIIRYADTGKGMSKEVLKNIFEPFFTTNRDAGYIGLGLHVAYNLVIQILGGTIQCESELGHGATFTIAITPIAAQQI